MIDKKKILIVDDVPANLDLLYGLLSPIYEIQVAKSGMKALELARKKPTPSLILLDIMMPNMDGFQVCSTLKASSETDMIPIIFLSAKSEVEDEMEGFNLGCVDYIVKPFNPKLLLTRINTHVELREKKVLLENALSELADSHTKIVEQEKMASLGYLLSGVAHEVNTPLGLCKTSASNLFDLVEELKESSVSDTIDKQKSIALLDDILLSRELLSKNLNKLIDLISEFKEAAVNQNTYERKTFNIISYLASVAPFLIYGDKNKEVKLEITPESVIEISSYPAIFIQIFKNLISNSLQYAFEDIKNPLISINVTKEEKQLLIHYSDNGVGMNYAQSSKVFDPFYTTGRFHGSKGLGLFVVFILVSKHLNGTIKFIEAESGTNYLITIPI